MNRRFIVIALVSMLCLFALPGGAEVTTIAPNASLDVTLRDFGQVNMGTLVTERYRLRNSGAAPLKVNRVKFSMPGMKIKMKQQIAPGEEAEVRIDWDTSHYSGEIEGKALLYLNDPIHSKILLTLKGNVVAPIDILPMPAFYMSQYQGEEKSHSLTIQNNQARKLQITKLEPKGEHFLASLETTEPGRSYRLKVEVPADTPVGRYREAVIVHTDDPANARLTVEVNVLVKPDVYVTPETANFGELSLTKLQHNPGTLDLIEQTFIIKKREGDMVITKLESDIPFLKLTSAPNVRAQVFRIDVGLDLPTLQTGAMNGSIQLLTDDPENPKLSIPVRGIIRK